MTKITADPADFVKHLTALEAFVGFLITQGVAHERAAKILNDLMLSAAREFKQMVTDELLESQRTTNDALAAALNMRGVRE